MSQGDLHRSVQGGAAASPSLVLAGVSVSVQQSCHGFLEFLLSPASVSRLSPDKQSQSDVTKCFPSGSLRDLCLCGCTGV